MMQQCGIKFGRKETRMKKILIALLVLLCTTAALADRDDDVDRLQSSATVIKEIMSAPDSGVPEEIITKTKCIAVIPSMLKAAFGVGGAYGKGVASCRTEKGWSAPAFFSLKGGSFGFQIGGQAADIVMLIMNDSGMSEPAAKQGQTGRRRQRCRRSRWAATPMPRRTGRCVRRCSPIPVLAALFAGISLNGAVLTQHSDDTRDFYGRMVPFRSILLGNVPSPKEAELWRDTLAKYAGK